MRRFCAIGGNTFEGDGGIRESWKDLSAVRAALIPLDRRAQSEPGRGARWQCDLLTWRIRMRQMALVTRCRRRGSVSSNPSESLRGYALQPGIAALPGDPGVMLPALPHPERGPSLAREAESPEGSGLLVPCHHDSARCDCATGQSTSDSMSVCIWVWISGQRRR